MPWVLVRTILIVPLLFGGCAWYKMTVHEYGYQAQPPAAPPGTPPPPPPPPPPPVPPAPYPTFYKSAWDDPTLIVFVNQSARTVRIEVDDKRAITLAPFQPTADLHFGVGEHKVRVVVEKETAMGHLEVPRFLTLLVRPDGRSQIIYVYE